MQHEEPVKEIVTVAEMARACGFSRRHFYSLIAQGVMPTPNRNPQTGRPFYTREQQGQCLRVRRTNCGVNGKPILFYCHAPRSPQMPSTKRKPRPTKPRDSSRAAVEPVIEELRHGLAQLGLTEVTDAAIRNALAECYPDGHAEVGAANVLMNVFRSLKRRNLDDNVNR